MVFNFVTGFILPWIFGALLYRRDRQAVLLSAPIAGLTSSVIGNFGFRLGFWDLAPFPMDIHCSALPVHLGLYPILGSFYTHYLRQQPSVYKSMQVLIGFSVLTTLLELVGLVLGRVVYGRGWCLASTFVSYLVSYVIGYWHFVLLRRTHIWR